MNSGELIRIILLKVKCIIPPKIIDKLRIKFWVIENYKISFSEIKFHCDQLWNED